MMYAWRDLAWPDFNGIDFDKAVALMPVAAIEQHGPHLPVSVDSDINAGVVAASAAYVRHGDPEKEQMAAQAGQQRGMQIGAKLGARAAAQKMMPTSPAACSRRSGQRRIRRRPPSRSPVWSPSRVRRPRA